MSSKKKVKTAGAPSKYKQEYCQLVITHCAEGLSFESFAGEIGVCRETLYEWCKVHKDFSHARKAARQASQLALERMGQKLIKGQMAQGASSSAWIFTMKNIVGWRDQPEVQDDDADDWEIE